MPGLRERVIAAICEEWPNPDNEVNSATIYERLKSAGDATSEVEVRQVLLQLSDHGDITLVLEPGRGSGPVVAAVRAIPIGIVAVGHYRLCACTSEPWTPGERHFSGVVGRGTGPRQSGVPTGVTSQRLRQIGNVRGGPAQSTP